MHCAYCRQGYESLCSQAKLHGFTHDGTFQQYAVSYTNHLTRIPDGLGLDEAAPVLCAGVTVYKAIKQSGVRVGQWIALRECRGVEGQVWYGRSAG
jgi:propanol-preferring alcohol dehydrogenase